MKNIILLALLLYSVAPLYARTSTTDNLLRIIEHGDLEGLSQLQLKDFGFREQLITGKWSASRVYREIKKSGKTAIIKNVQIVDSLQLNPENSDLARVVFQNCLFTNKVIVDRAKIPQHLAFFGCKFRKDFTIFDFSTENLTFFANEFDSSFLYAARYMDNSVSEFYFVLNTLKNISIEALNVYIPCPYSGKVTFGNFWLSSNFIQKVNLSAPTVKEIIFIRHNIIDTLEVNGARVDYLLVAKYNRIANCQLKNLLEKEEAHIFIISNSLDSFLINSAVVRTFGFVSNKVKTAKIYNTITKLVLRFVSTIFMQDASIHLAAGDHAKIAFFIAQDSVNIATVDTLSYSDSLKENALTLSNPTFFIKDSASSIPLVLRLNQRNFPIPTNNDLFAFTLTNTPIHERNWFVRFENIARIGNFYRINPNDLLLANRHEVYTSIQKAYANQGKWNQADQCFYEWKEFERKNYWKLSQDSWLVKIPKTLFNYLNWVSCGYGIKPLWIFPFAFFIILAFAFFYYFTPQPISNLEYHLASPDKIKKELNNRSQEELSELLADYDFNFEAHKQELIEDIMATIDKGDLITKLGLDKKSKFSLEYFWNCFYFSFSIFTTVGIGDWYPTGKMNKAIVMVEGSLGWLCLGLFITTYANILLR